LYQPADPYLKVLGDSLSPEARASICLHVKSMLDDLLSNRLCVGLVPAPNPRFHGHMIRWVNSSNPAWYQRAYAVLDVKRDRILDSLARVAKGKASNKSSYDRMFIKMAKDRLLNGYDDYGYYVYPDNSARALFGLPPEQVQEYVPSDYSDDFEGF